MDTPGGSKKRPSREERDDDDDGASMGIPIAAAATAGTSTTKTATMQPTQLTKVHQTSAWSEMSTDTAEKHTEMLRSLYKCKQDLLAAIEISRQKNAGALLDDFIRDLELKSTVAKSRAPRSLRVDTTDDESDAFEASGHTVAEINAQIAAMWDGPLRGLKDTLLMRPTYLGNPTTMLKMQRYIASGLPNLVQKDIADLQKREITLTDRYHALVMATDDRSPCIICLFRDFVPRPDEVTDKNRVLREAFTALDGLMTIQQDDITKRRQSAVALFNSSILPVIQSVTTGVLAEYVQACRDDISKLQVDNPVMTEHMMNHMPKNEGKGRLIMMLHSASSIEAAYHSTGVAQRDPITGIRRMDQHASREVRDIQKHQMMLMKAIEASDEKPAVDPSRLMLPPTTGSGRRRGPPAMKRRRET